MSSTRTLALLLARRNAVGVVAPVAPTPVFGDLPPRDWTALRSRPELGDPFGDPNDIAVQGWAVIVSSEDVELVASLGPLLDLREEEIGRRPEVLEVPRDVEPEVWRDEVYRRDRPLEEVPRFLLILGDLDRVPMSLQQHLCHEAFVGRLPTRDLRVCAAYAEKVCRAEAQRPDAGADVVFYSSRDGSAAVEEAERHLLKPCASGLQIGRRSGRLPARSVRTVDGRRFLDHSDVTDPRSSARTVLVSVAHGLGAPDGGWTSAADQRALQGALVMNGERLFGAREVSRAPFIPGGAWLSVACFGAATPAEDVYFQWAQQLRVAPSTLNYLLESQPIDGRGFVAATASAALANPEGPQCVYGHAGLAWGCSYLDAAERSRADRFSDLVGALVKGRRAGVALGASLHRSFWRVDAMIVDAERRAANAPRRFGRASAPDQEQIDYLRLTREDLRAYMLLGDPAVRIVP